MKVVPNDIFKFGGERLNKIIQTTKAERKVKSIYAYTSKGKRKKHVSRYTSNCKHTAKSQI